MATLSADPTFKVYVICSVILSMLMLTLGFLTARARAANKKYLNPEDAAVSFKDATPVEGAEHPDVARVQRAHRNLLESLPMFFGVGLLYILAHGSPLGGQICFGVFTGARVLHAVVYLRSLQPWRTIFFALGSISLVALMVQLLLAVFA